MDAPGDFSISAFGHGNRAGSNTHGSQSYVFTRLPPSTKYPASTFSLLQNSALPPRKAYF
ncbi:hypothetical protein FRC03_007921 [Tulasnella sp. 419]|nr:hypothetical protein FRC02_005070 [Tulasnella sp. 418]KAG8937701.1 hypothetical protein FRC03_007921 [Tulasnella sp. 419]